MERSKDGQKQPQQVFCKKDVLRNFTKLTHKKTPSPESLFNKVAAAPGLFLNKIAGLKPATLLKKRRWYRCFFPVNFVKFLRTPFLTDHLR